jgi:hypothetical protein
VTVHFGDAIISYTIAPPSNGRHQFTITTVEFTHRGDDVYLSSGPRNQEKVGRLPNLPVQRQYKTPLEQIQMLFQATQTKGDSWAVQWFNTYIRPLPTNGSSLNLITPEEQRIGNRQIYTLDLIVDV